MPKKVLRSIIQAAFPLDLRVEIELISRNRSLTKPQKKEKIILALKKYGITDFTQLGPGTNRYTIRYCGFVFKFATDSEGRMDNKTEFKMAKRLYPDVIQCNEITENGTILVCEYIQMYENYGEMYAHKDKILKILQEISTVFFIGDVGISQKNYANWGSRVGSDKPVCLDFAYIYEVSSNLFICKKCKTNTMLVPTQDFNGLYCPNPQCGQTYTFEELRGQISNKVHLESIGDLSEEGYLMTEPTQLVELDTQRSNYLLLDRKSKKKDKEVKEKTDDMSGFFDHFTCNCNMLQEQEESKMKEELIMSNAKRKIEKILEAIPFDEDRGVFEPTDGPIIEAVPIDDDSVEDTVVAETVEEPTPVMSCDLDDFEDETISEEEIQDAKEIVEDVMKGQPSLHDIISAAEEEIQDTNEVYDHEEAEGYEATIGEEAEVELEAWGDYPEGNVVAPFEEDVPDVVEEENSNSDVIEPEEEVEEELSVEEENKVFEKVDDSNELSKEFIYNIKSAISRLANVIGLSIKENKMYYQIMPNLKNKHVLEENFYTEIQNAVYKSLIFFIGIKEEKVYHKDKPGYQLIWQTPDNLYDESIYPTLKFIDRFFTNEDLTDLPPMEILENYISIYDDYQGISEDWIKCLVKRINTKIPIDQTGIVIITNFIKKYWCVKKAAPTPTPEPPKNPPMESKEVIKEESEEPAMETPIEDHNVSDEELAAFGASIIHDILGDPEEDEDDSYKEYEDDDDEEEDESTGVGISIHMDEYGDIVTICASTPWQDINIPIYCNLENIDPNIKEKNNNINGDWNWLQCIPPSLLFYAEDNTANINEWIKDNDSTTDNCKIICFGKSKEKPGKVIMGFYLWSGIIAIKDDGEPVRLTSGDIIKKALRAINPVVNPYTNLSYRTRALKNKTEILSEEYVRDWINGGMVDEIDLDNMKDDYNDLIEKEAEEVVEDRSWMSKAVASSPISEEDFEMARQRIHEYEETTSHASTTPTPTPKKEVKKEDKSSGGMTIPVIQRKAK